MSRARMLLLVALIAVVAVVAFFYFRRDGGDDVVTVERGSIDVTIDTVGTVQIRDPQPVRAKAAGTIEAVGAEPGDEVEAGDILALIDPEDLATQVEDAEDALTAAEFELQFAELRLEDDEDAIDRQQAVIQAQEIVERAREALEEAQEWQSNGAIVADRSGTVLEMLVVPGDQVGVDQPVARLFTSDDLILVADIDELDLPNVQPGAAVRVRLDSFPAAEIDGSVLRTSPQAVQRGGATLFPADVRITIPDHLDIRPGMNADVTIVTDLRENVLLVPERALRTVGRRAFVEVEEDGEFTEVEVILGYRSGGVAEVVSGLEEGDRVRLR